MTLLGITMRADAKDYSKYYQNLPTEVKPVVEVVIPDYAVSVTDFGGVGDGSTLNTEAFRKAISALTKKGGGRVVVPQGVWLTGPIVMKDNIELRIEKNAIVMFSDFTRKVTMQNLFHDGGFSSMGMSLRAMNQYSKDLTPYEDENGKIIYG